jgi:hypothetical protein
MLSHIMFYKGKKNSKGNNENLKDLNNVLLQCSFNLTKITYEKNFNVVVPREGSLGRKQVTNVNDKGKDSGMSNPCTP